MHKIFFCIVLFVCMVLAGCKSVLPAVTPTNVHNTETDRVRTEYVHDTVTVDRLREIVRKGDTVYVHDTTTIREWHTEKLRDSVYVNNTDTIYQPQPYEVQVPEEHGFLWKSGIAMWVIVSLILLAGIIGIILKFAK